MGTTCSFNVRGDNQDENGAAIRMRAGGREISNNCAEPGPVQALFEGADLWLPRVNRD
jgi:hypothetical protein